MVDLGKLARVDWASHARVALATSQAMIPYAAIGSSILFALAPLPDIRRIRRAKHTLSLPFLPFFFYALQSAIFLVYAWVTANPVLKTTTSLGVLLGTYYLAVYYTYSSDKVVARKWMAGGFAVVLALMGIAATWEAADAAMMIGLPGALHILSLAMAAMVPTKCGNAVMILTAVSPLAKAATIIASQDASSLPVGMSIMNAVAGAIWTLYGILLQDRVVTVPNAVSTVVGLIQIGLLVRYPSTPKAKRMHAV